MPTVSERKFKVGDVILRLPKADAGGASASVLAKRLEASGIAEAGHGGQTTTLPMSKLTT